MIGKTISHYKIIEKLGEGGMGVVYKAKDTKLEREVAIKFLPRHIAANSEERERFKIEAKTAASLNHPNIGIIHAIEEVDDDMFIVMEYIKGQELREIIRGTGPLALSEVIDYATQIAGGLQAAHDENVIHRDIKSANIMITDKGQVKIMDFGLAKLQGGAQLTKINTTLGTAAYMSPEQARGEEADKRADIWSFGVVFYEMLTGQLPFGGEYEQAVIYSILNEEAERISNFRDDVPETVSKIVASTLAKDMTETPSFTRLMRRPVIAVPAILLLLVSGFFLTRWYRHSAEISWARHEILPQIELLTNDIKLTGNGLEAWAAFQLSQQAIQIIPDDPLLKLVYPKFSRKVKIFSEPSRAKVFAIAYADSAQEWRYFGKTPLDSVNLPVGFSRVKIETEGYRPAYDILWNAPALSDTLSYKLIPAESISNEMNLVPAVSNWYNIPAAPAGLHMPGLEHFEAVAVGDFLMDRYEVTNKAYKLFVDAGGYQNRTYWRYPFNADGRISTWQEAMASFIDRTGQPGPATWEVGDYPEGQDDYPVTGVNWFEAAAYAEFAEKSLPTVYHWDRVALTWASSAIVPMSNLMGKAPRRVGSSNSMNRFGIFDLAGNAREWCFNKGSRGGRFILGGGWDDPAYGFNDAFAQSPFDRSETNGFRCIRYLHGEADHDELEATIQLPFRDFLNEKPVSDATFELFRNQYAYDKTPFNAVIESVDESEDWVRQKIIFDAAYGNERMMAYLFLPKGSQPPFQTAVYFPGSGAIHTRSSTDLKPRWSNEFLLKSGRALMVPIYKSTYERGDGLKSDYPDKTNFWKEHVIMWTKDFSRSIDYLETREDIDSDKLVYYGASWGGAMGGIIPAVENRIKTSVLLVAGLLFQHALPEVEPVNFLPRITMPVLMLNGKYDFFFPYETSQRPFFELLGTPQEHKKLFVYEGGHSVPRTELVKEMLAWLDHYLGSVNRM
jgi:serine/threonine protein kinase/dienelactone hydrolase